MQDKIAFCKKKIYQACQLLWYDFFKNKKLLQYVLYILNVIIIDRFTKYLAIYHHELYFAPFQRLLHLPPIKNYGFTMNLCLFSEAKFMFFLRIISIAITVYFFKQAKIKYKKNKNIFPEATIIAGAIGNLIDRFYYGYVIDFIFFNFPFTQYIAIANIADVAITIGCAWLMLKMIIHDVLRKKEKSNSKKKSFRHPMRNTNYEIE